ncbi:MAG TPA: VOC family protein [Planctomycetota bacterium]|nr:VOC family protein [Planctomycetota bacterium]
MPNAKPIPEGFHTVTPHLVVDGAAQAIDFYKRAFGAEELGRMPAPDGKKLMHAALRIGDSMLMLADDFPEFCGGVARNPKALGESPVTLHLYVQDCDAAMKRAEQAGATVTMPLADMFWGDRYGHVKDPFGHTWSIATHQRDVSPEDMDRESKKVFGGA